MHRLFIALLAAVTLAAPTSAHAQQKPRDGGPSRPSSYAPGPRSKQHVYGSPIETHHAPATAVPRTKASSKQSKIASHHKAPHQESRGHQPAPAPAPS